MTVIEAGPVSVPIGRAIDAVYRARYLCLMSHCQNCERRLDGPYCATCGQRDIDLERPVWSLIRDVVKETLELDGRAAVTLKTLFRHPGMLTSEFLAGRRQTFTPPLRLYLVISISFFVLFAWFAQSGALLAPGQDPGFDAAVQARFLSEDLPHLMFIMLPVFALLLKIVYLRRLYFDHMIFSLHLHSAAYVILAVILSLEDLSDRHTTFLISQFALFVCFLAYFLVAVRRVYQSGWLTSVLKSAIVLFGYMLAVSVVIENSSNFRIIAD